MTANDDRPGGGAEATNHNAHSQEADTPEGTSAEAPADDGDEFWGLGQQAKPAAPRRVVTMSPDEVRSAAPEETADHQTDPHRQDQASSDPTGAGGRGEDEHGGREQALRLYLYTCCGDSPGWLHVAIGNEPFVTDKGARAARLLLFTFNDARPGSR